MSDLKMPSPTINKLFDTNLKMPVSISVKSVNQDLKMPTPKGINNAVEGLSMPISKANEGLSGVEMPALRNLHSQSDSVMPPAVEYNRTSDKSIINEYPSLYVPSQSGNIYTSLSLSNENQSIVFSYFDKSKGKVVKNITIKKVLTKDEESALKQKFSNKDNEKKKEPSFKQKDSSPKMENTSGSVMQMKNQTGGLSIREHNEKVRQEKEMER